MKYDNLIVLIPAHSLEDFPSEIGDREAESLMNAFAVLWHPALLASAGVMPAWHRADLPPEFTGNRLVIVPTASDSWMPGGWIDRARSEGAVVIAGVTDREEMLRQALEGLEGRGTRDEGPGSDNASIPENPTPGDPAPQPSVARPSTLDPSPDLVADFLALGTCWLQVELLTRKMHYYSNLNEADLQREAVAAAQAALAGDDVAARSRLGACFEVLTSARERFYSSDCYLVDLCLLTPSVIDEHLTKTVASRLPVNFLATGTDLETIAAEKPKAAALLKEAWHAGTIDMIGGEHAEGPSPLLPVGSVLYDFRRGHETFERIFGRTPTTWARRRFGFTPLVPQILARFGYHGALHVALDDGIYPDTEQSRIRWEGCDGSLIDAMTRIPLAADGPGSYLRFASRMAESMQQDQSAAIAFARWPDVKSPFFEDFRRSQQYSPCLGKWVTFQSYFETSDSPGRLSKYEAREYFTPFLIQAVARQEVNPLSRYRDHHLRRHRYDAAAWCAGTAPVLERRTAQEVESILNETASTSRAAGVAGVERSEPPAERAESTPHEPSTSPARSAGGEQSLDPSHPQPSILDPQLSPEQIIESGGPDADAAAMQRAASLVEEFSTSSARELAGVIANGGGDRPGVLVINPLSFTRRAVVAVPQLESPPAVGGAVKGAQFDGVRKMVTVEVPGCEFVWLTPGGAAAPAKGKGREQSVLMAEGTLLRNEFFEVHVNEATGGIARIKNYGRSPNRLSQQLAFRFPRERTIETEDGPTRTFYSEMRCHGLEITSDGPALGEIVTRGDIFDQHKGVVLATFTQTVRLWRGRPVAELDIDLDVKQAPDGDPWTNYIASRFAWNDPTATITRSFQQGAHSFQGERIESPHYLELATPEERTTILTMGLPFHRKTGGRMIDSLLVTAGEAARRFEFRIAVDADYPMEAALDAMVPATAVAANGPPRTGETGWLFHVDARSVQLVGVSELDATEPPLEAWEQHDRPATPSGPGCVVRLVETEGRRKRVKLRCFRNPASARQRDFQGRTVQVLSLDSDAVIVEMSPYEIADVEVRF